MIPALEYGMVGAAALVDGWGVPRQGVAAARKARLREISGRNGIDQPEWTLVDGPANVDRFSARFGGRCVVKPMNRQASVGVRLLDPWHDAAQAWESSTVADEATQRARYSLLPRYLAEQRLDGPEISVEALVVDGACVFANITAKVVKHGERPVELGHVVPAALDAGVDAAVRAATDRLLAAVGYRSGVVHAEWILVDGCPHLIECAG